MKVFLKITGIICASLLAILYLSFLFLLPRYDINQYKADWQKLVSEQTKLNLDFENAKIITTPLLGVGVKADKISVTLPDKSTLFNADSAKVRLALPSLFLLTVKVSSAEVEKPFLNVEIVDDKAFKVMEIFEELMDNKEVMLEEVTQEAETKKSGLAFNPDWIRIKIPCVKLKDYEVLVNDLKSGHYLKLSGDEMKLGYFNGKIVKFATNAKLFSDDKENISANIAVNTFLPPAVKLDAEDDKPERVDIAFVNPVTMYRNYDLKSNIDVKLRVRERFGNIISFGHANIDGLTLKISQLQLPESYFHFKTKGFWADIASNINVFENENISLNGKLNYSKHPKMAMDVKTDKIYFNDIIVLARAVFDSLHIKHDLAKISMAGYVQADTFIKTNFKKLNSNGSVVVNDGALTIKGIGNVLDNFKALVALDNNVLEIKDTSLNLAGAKVYADGKIDEKSVADIKINTERISLPVLFNAFAPNDVKRSINLKSGNAGLKLNIQGKLDKAVANVDLDLQDFNITDRANTFNFGDKALNAKFSCDKNDLKGNIESDGLKIYLPQTKSDVSIPKFALSLTQGNLNIPENEIIINNSSKLNFKGYVKDYVKLEDVNLSLNGKFLSSDLTKLIGNEYSKFLNAQGAPSLNVTIQGNPKKQTLEAEILADSENHFTPVNLQPLQGKSTAIRSTLDFKKNRIKIKDTGIFTKNKITDEKGNVKYTYNEVIGIDGTVAGNNINLLKINIPQNIKGSIQGLTNSAFTLDGHLNIFGDMSSPHYRGTLNLSGISIPDLMITSSKINLAFKGKELVAKLEDLLVNGSDFNVNTTLSLAPSTKLNISGMDIKSNYVDADKLIQVSDKAMKLIPSSPSTSSNANSASADIPIVLRNGHFNGKSLKSGDIETGLTNTDFSLNNNILVLNNLSTKVFDGNVKGNISINLLSTLMQIKLSGSNVNVDKMLVQAAAMKDTLSGSADFTTDISLKGTTYEEQVKSLKGNVDFDAKDGQFGPFGKLENLIIAENIRESQFFQTALGGVINSLTQIDTTHFDSLTGHLSFNDGIVAIDPIISKGNALALKLFGDMDILANKINTKAQAKMTSSVANVLGPLNAINPINIMNSAGGMNVLTAQAFSLFCEAVPQEEMDKIPEFDNKYIDTNALKFQLGIRGDLAKPLTLVKSFKWLALASDMEKAENFVELLPAGKNGENYVIDPKVLQKVTKEELKQQAELAKQQIKENAKQNVEAKKQEVLNAAQETVDAKVQEMNDKAQQRLNAKLEEGKNSKVGKFLKGVKEISDQLDAMSEIEQTQSAQQVQETVESEN